MLYASVSLLLLFAGASLCAPEHAPDSSLSVRDHELSPSEHEHDTLAKRSPHYDFGLGKRAYTYVSEYKRLPVYNFGLGKRSPLYSFGLGKRSVEDDDHADEDFSPEDQAALDELFDQYDVPGYEVKRARPYSFGLGKRYIGDDNEDKRAKMYEFGLGKRLPLYNFGLGKRARNYNFGLGKRLAKYNFGLGKRQRDLHRFSFGLGKRTPDESDEVDESS